MIPKRTAAEARRYKARRLETANFRLLQPPPWQNDFTQLSDFRTSKGYRPADRAGTCCANGFLGLHAPPSGSQLTRL